MRDGERFYLLTDTELTIVQEALRPLGFSSTRGEYEEEFLQLWREQIEAYRDANLPGEAQDFFDMLDWRKLHTDRMAERAAESGRVVLGDFDGQALAKRIDELEARIAALESKA